MRFITSVYGDLYLPFLWTLLQSITIHHPGDFVTILYNNIAHHEIRILEYYFPDFSFLKNEIKIFEKEYSKRIPLKLRYWTEACTFYPNELLCFLDCDTLIYSNISKYFNNSFDVIYTWKEHIYPINTGVILLNSKKNTCLFMKKWLKYTERIIDNYKYFKKDLKTYGASDQCALQEIIKIKDYYKTVQRKIEGETFKFKGVLCTFLNETECKSITKNTHILHYKGGWHKIFLEEGSFTKKRPIETCKKMFNYWVKNYKKIVEISLKFFVFESSKKYLEQYSKNLSKLEESWILNYEMLMKYFLIQSLGIDLVILSVSFNRHPAIILMTFLSKIRNIRIISIEKRKYTDAGDIEKNLANYENINFLYGNFNHLIPKIVAKNQNKKISIVFDGHKGVNPIKIYKNVISKYHNVIAGFFDGMRKSTEFMKNPSRKLMEDSFSRIIFSDNLDYINIFRDFNILNLSSAKHLRDTGDPYIKRNSRTENYDPTMAVVLPLERERIIYQKKNIVYFKDFFLSKFSMILDRILGNDIYFFLNKLNKSIKFFIKKKTLNERFMSLN